MNNREDFDFELDKKAKEVFKSFVPSSLNKQDKWGNYLNPDVHNVFVAFKYWYIEQQKIIDDLMERLQLKDTITTGLGDVIDTLEEEIKENESCCWELQKQIDGLKEELEEQERFVKTTRDDCIYYLKKIEQLEALNPDVPCPVCNGKRQECEYERYEDGTELDGEIKEDVYGKPILKWFPCECCNTNGKVSLTKAQEYRIRELGEKLDDILGGVVWVKN